MEKRGHRNQFKSGGYSKRRKTITYVGGAVEGVEGEGRGGENASWQKVRDQYVGEINRSLAPADSRAGQALSTVHLCF